MSVHKETPLSVLSPFLLFFLPSLPLSFLSFSPAPVLPELMKFLLTPALCMSGWEWKAGCLFYGVVPLSGRGNLWLGLGVPKSTFSTRIFGSQREKEIGGVAGEAERWGAGRWGQRVKCF